jgi:thymidylate synthase
VNQVAELVDGLRRNPGSRRHIVEGWNVAELDAMALPPCHKTYQFHVAGNRLSCVLYQRSCDVVLGLPFNLWGAALFVHMLAQQCDLEPGELVWMGGDTHLYLNHADLIEAQLQREPSGDPRLGSRAAPIDLRLCDRDFAVRAIIPRAISRRPSRFEPAVFRGMVQVSTACCENSA